MMSSKQVKRFFFLSYSAVILLPLRGIWSCMNSFDSETAIPIFLCSALFLEVQLLCWWKILMAVYKNVFQGVLDSHSRKEIHQFIFFWSFVSVFIGMTIVLELFDPSHFSCSRGCYENIIGVKNNYQCAVIATIVLMGVLWTFNLQYYLNYCNLTRQQKCCTRWVTFSIAVLALMVSSVKYYKQILDCDTPHWMPIMLFQHPSFVFYFLAFLGLILDKTLTERTLFDEPVTSRMWSELSMLGIVGVMMLGFASGVYYLMNEFAHAIESRDHGCAYLQKHLYLDWVMILVPIFYNMCYFFLICLHYFVARRNSVNGVGFMGENSKNLIEKMKSRTIDDLKHLPDILSRSQECLICLEEFSKQPTESYFITDDCKHLFHFDCLCNWIKSDKITCPTCRGVINVK